MEEIMEKYEINFEELEEIQQKYDVPIYRLYDNGFLIINNIIFCQDNTCSENEYIKVYAHDIMNFCSGLGYIKDYRDIMSSFDFESSEQRVAKDAEGKVINKTNYIEKQTESDGKSVFSYIQPVHRS